MAKFRSRIDLKEFFDKIPKDSIKVKDYVFDNIGKINSEQLGLNQKPTTLLDVLAYRDDPKYEDFDFFETYENSPAAKRNLELSESWITKLNEFDEQETEFIDDLYDSDITEVASKIAERVREYVEEIQASDNSGEEKNKESNNGTD
jgi:hypothetical protein